MQFEGRPHPAQRLTGRAAGGYASGHVGPGSSFGWPLIVTRPAKNGMPSVPGRAFAV
jgi:hypothetical protein